MRWLMPITLTLALSSAAQAADIDLFIRIIECESGGRHDAKNEREPRGGISFGIAQFQKPTFEEFKKKAGHPEYKWENPIHQMKLLAWVIKDRPDLLPHWVCWRKMQKGKSKNDNIKK